MTLEQQWMGNAEVPRALPAGAVLRPLGGVSVGGGFGKSSYSGISDQCVEAAWLPVDGEPTVLMRDSKTGDSLAFPSAAWQGLIDSVRGDD